MEIVDDFARAYPSLTMIYSFIIKDMYLFIFLIISEMLNWIFKYSIAKPLMGDKDYGILLGKGTRPKGASHCGLWKDPPDYKTKSYGMPSGHSQNASAFGTYMILKNLSDNKGILYNSNLLIGYFMLFIPYSRIYLNCHTPQQVIIGSLLGIILGLIAWNIKPTILGLIN